MLSDIDNYNNNNNIIHIKSILNKHIFDLNNFINTIHNNIININMFIYDNIKNLNNTTNLIINNNKKSTTCGCFYLI